MAKKAERKRREEEARRLSGAPIRTPAAPPAGAAEVPAAAPARAGKPKKAKVAPAAPAAD